MAKEFTIPCYIFKDDKGNVCVSKMILFGCENAVTRIPAMVLRVAVSKVKNQGIMAAYQSVRQAMPDISIVVAEALVDAIFYQTLTKQATFVIAGDVDLLALTVDDKEKAAAIEREMLKNNEIMPPFQYGVITVSSDNPEPDVIHPDAEYYLREEMRSHCVGNGLFSGTPREKLEEHFKALAEHTPETYRLAIVRGLPAFVRIGLYD